MSLNVVIKIIKIIRKALIGYACAINRKEIVSVNSLATMRNLSLDVISLIVELKNEEAKKTMEEENNE